MFLCTRLYSGRLAPDAWNQPGCLASGDVECVTGVDGLWEFLPGQLADSTRSPVVRVAHGGLRRILFSQT